MVNQGAKPLLHPFGVARRQERDFTANPGRKVYALPAGGSRMMERQSVFKRRPRRVRAAQPVGGGGYLFLPFGEESCAIGASTRGGGVDLFPALAFPAGGAGGGEGAFLSSAMLFPLAMGSARGGAEKQDAGRAGGGRSGSVQPGKQPHPQANEMRPRNKHVHRADKDADDLLAQAHAVRIGQIHNFFVVAGKHAPRVRPAAQGVNGNEEGGKRTCAGDRKQDQGRSVVSPGPHEIEQGYPGGEDGNGQPEVGVELRVLGRPSVLDEELVLLPGGLKNDVKVFHDFRLGQIRHHASSEA